MLIKVLNLYSGLGGNRRLWDRVEVTAVENEEDIAKVYHELHPNDNVIVADAHAYLEEHYKEYDFIWSSPPCQSHSSFRQNIDVRFRGTNAIYPDMRLYQEILFLQYNFEGLWVVENVKPYYTPLIEPTVLLQRHLIWSNFDIPIIKYAKTNLRGDNKISDLEAKHGIEISGYKLKNKRQLLRNCVDRELGKYVFDIAQKRIDAI